MEGYLLFMSVASSVIASGDWNAPNVMTHDNMYKNTFQHT